jgi:hypothetical protein
MYCIIQDKCYYNYINNANGETKMRAQFKYAAVKTIEYMSEFHGITTTEVMAGIDKGGNWIADEFTMLMVMTFEALAAK